MTKRMEIESGPIDTIFLAVARKPLREAMAQAPVGTPRVSARKILAPDCSCAAPQRGQERRKAEIDALKVAISENCTEIERARRLPLDHTSSLRAHLVTRG